MSIERTAAAFRREGSLWVNNNPTIDTGVALTGATQTAFGATIPSIIITDNDTSLWSNPGAGGTGFKKIEIDQIWLKVVAPGTGTTQLECAIVIDSSARYSSGGTDVSANSVNATMMDVAPSIAKVYTGTITATAAVAARQVGRAVLRTVLPAAGDVYFLDFGPEGMGVSGIPAGTPAILQTYKMPGIVIGPGQSALLYIWGAGMTAAPTFEYQIVWVER